MDDTGMLPRVDRDNVQGRRIERSGARPIEAVPSNPSTPQGAFCEGSGPQSSRLQEWHI